MTYVPSNNSQPDLQNVVVVLRFDSGDFNQGFSVTLREMNNGRCENEEFHDLPPAPELPQQYQVWARRYDSLGLNWAEISPVEGIRTHEASLDDCHTAAVVVERELKEWFSSPGFRLLGARIQASELVKRDRSVPIVFNFCTRNSRVDEQLRRLPWHLWGLFSHLDGAEAAISMGLRRSSSKLTLPVKVLAIFGSDRGGLSLDEDKETLKKILEPKGAEIEFSTQPTAEELNNLLYHRDGWDILFFTGHSHSDISDGRLLLSQDHSISLNVLEDAFRFAINKGLKLTIFNSCSGLGIASFFAGWDTCSNSSRFPGLALPSMIVMREQVPDSVARRFFREFLTEFVEREQPIYRAVREARNRLKFLDQERVDKDRNKQPYPCASWIPVICLNPNQPELSWPTPKDKPKKWKWLGIVGGIVAVVSLAWGFVNSKPESISITSGDEYSFGEEILLENSHNADNSDAQSGANSFKKKEYEEASRDFLNALKSEPNNPELLIYLNNAQAAISGKPINTIAVNIPGTDDPADAKESLRGVAQFQVENNCGIEHITKAIENPESLNCQGSDTALQVLIADHENRNDVDKILQSFKEIAADSRVRGLIGGYNSSMTFAVEQKLLDDDIVMPVIATTSTAVRKPAQVVSGYIFRPSPTDSVSADRLYNYLQHNEAERIVILSDSGSQSDYSQSLRGELYNLLPETLKKQTYDCDLSRIDSCFDEIQGESIDAIVLIPSDDRDFIDAALNFVNRYDARYEGDPIVLGGDTLYSKRQVLDRISEGSLLEQLVVSVPWHRSQNPTAFERDANELWGAQINWRTAMAYDAAKLLFEAASSLSTDCTDLEECRRAVRDAMLDKGLDNGATGEIHFSKDGNRNVGTSDRVSVLVGVDVSSNTFKCIPGEFCAE